MKLKLLVSWFNHARLFRLSTKISAEDPQSNLKQQPPHFSSVLNLLTYSEEFNFLTNFPYIGLHRLSSWAASPASSKRMCVCWWNEIYLLFACLWLSSAGSACRRSWSLKWYLNGLFIVIHSGYSIIDGWVSRKLLLWINTINSRQKRDVRLIYTCMYTRGVSVRLLLRRASLKAQFLPPLFSQMLLKQAANNLICPMLTITNRITDRPDFRRESMC